MVTDFIQVVSLNPKTDLNEELRTRARNYFEKDLFKLKNNSVFKKTVKNVRKHRDLRLLSNGRRRGLLWWNRLSMMQ